MFRVMADSIICKSLQSVLERIATASKARSHELQYFQPRLVAVTKTKPLSMITEAYACGQRHFGENYVQELEGKGKDTQVLKKCPEIKWHFIGHLQRNKVNKVLSVPNIWMVETIHSQKLAIAVDKGWEAQATGDKLRVMVQVNTSSEPQKHGCMPDEVTAMVKYVLDNCPHLMMSGLMTIGAFDHDLSSGPNPDFECLIECKKRLCSDLRLDPSEVQLSMGMSNDFEHAIEVGSFNVRVGSTIFGAREYKDKPASSETGTNSDPTKSSTSNDLKASNMNKVAATSSQVVESMEKLSTKES